MSYIKVNYNHLEQTATVIENFLNSHRKNMDRASEEVITLQAFWKGSDYDSFLQKWNELDNKNSTIEEFSDYLKSYKDILEYSAKEYKKAQKKAIHMANNLF